MSYFQSNESFIVEEFSDWINRATQTVKNMLENTEGEEKVRLHVKYLTLKMVRDKFNELKDER